MIFGKQNNNIWILQVMAHAFCLFFTFELAVRFLAFEHKRLFYKDPGGGELPAPPSDASQTFHRLGPLRPKSCVENWV